MAKIDNSTYKQIKKSRQLTKEGKYDKGHYGHWKHYRNIRILFASLLLIVILASVFLSLLIFHTKKTAFIIIACVMAIPFARNVTDIIMIIKAHPLSEESYNELENIFKDTGKKLLYDIMITETDGAVYIPCLYLGANNIIAYAPDYKDSKAREKIKNYINGANLATGLNYRIFVTERQDTFIKEVKKVNSNSSNADEDIKMKEAVLSMGI
ncbi:MAG: hypothetical protein K6E10_02515 [Eubacterium sp.]|nr:hypothetical protein [Eubacterium sp.]